MSVGGVASISPYLAGRWVNALWYRTHRFQEPAREKRFLKHAKKQSMKVDGATIQSYVWGEGDRTVLLIHGWNGRGAQLGEIALFLAEQGFRVVSFDLPGHGRSDGKQCDIPSVYAAIVALEQQYGPFHAAISHSFGGLCLMYALKNGLKINHAITISSPLDLASLFDSYAETLRLSEKVIAVQRALIEQRFGEDVWQQFTMVTQEAEHPVPGLLIHDHNDRHVGISSAQQIVECRPECEVMLTQNLGHHRILREPAVLQKVFEFIAK